MKKSRKPKRRKAGRVEPGEMALLSCACGYPKKIRVPVDVESARCHFCLMGQDWRHSTVNPNVVFKDEPRKVLSKEWLCGLRGEKVKRVRAHCLNCELASEDCKGHIEIYKKRLR